MVFKGTPLTELTKNYNAAIANATTEKGLATLLDEIGTGNLFNAKDQAYFRSEIERRRRELEYEYVEPDSEINEHVRPEYF